MRCAVRGVQIPNTEYRILNTEYLLNPFPVTSNQNKTQDHGPSNKAYHRL